MLNKNGERELCYVVKVDDIQPIQGRDKVECAVIGGWTCMVRKGQFNKGDLGIYFEIDSKVDTSKIERELKKEKDDKIAQIILDLELGEVNKKELNDVLNNISF